ncbi:MAG: hypothetical protein LKG20_07280 [Tetrasphaera jenkinsii]|nr:hypothetical protein [Tetrasphaera jenkinsii]
MFRLNLPKPELQVPFNDADGLIGYVDFLWRRRGKRPLVGEFDGRVKYRLGGLTSQTDIERTLWEEKRREDRLRKQADVVRWTWTSAIDASRLGRELAAYGITPGAAGWVRGLTVARPPKCGGWPDDLTSNVVGRLRWGRGQEG